MASNALGRAISGVDFPATKEDLLRQAKKKNASNKVLQQIESLPNIHYHSLQRIRDILHDGPRRDSAVTVSPAQNQFYYETLDGALRELHFPATKEQLLEESKGLTFAWGKNDILFSLTDVIEDLEEEEYRKAEEVMDEINTFIRKNSTTAVDSFS